MALCLPFVYGTIANFLGKRAAESASHSWVVYVRGSNGEDLSYVIEKVVFTLHDSFQTPVREVTSAPFQVEEVGWGEFDINIRVYFFSTPAPLELVHTLRLYHSSGAVGGGSRRPVVSEVYDEVLFTRPSRLLEERLRAGPPPAAADAAPNPYSHLWEDMSPTPHLELLREANVWVDGELKRLRDEMIKVDHEIATMQRDLTVLGVPVPEPSDTSAAATAAGAVAARGSGLFGASGSSPTESAVALGIAAVGQS